MRRTTIILGGNRAAGEVKCTAVGFIPVAAWSLLSLEVGKVQNAPLEREGSRNPKSREETVGFGAIAGYLAETQQNHCKSCLAKEQRR